MNFRKTLCCTLCLVLAFDAPRAAQFDGRVVGVADGDSIIVLDDTGAQHRVRISGIDAPEKGQPFSDRAKRNLSDLVFDKAVKVDWYKLDRYGRTVGTVWVVSPDAPCQETDCPKTLDAGMAQLTVGLAWHDKPQAAEQNERDRERYSFAEEEARARRAGLWQDPGRVPPWEWRRAHPSD